ncbi:MAG: cytochrome P450 [Pseudomonadales bacterium]
MNIDLLDPATFRGGHPASVYDYLLAEAPVYWHDEPGGPGFWVVTRYQDVYDIGRNAAVFSSSPTIMIQDPTRGAGGRSGEHQMMLMMDPPEHTSYRKLISRAFTQGPAKAYDHRIKALATRIVDAVADRGECEFMAEIAGEMPSFVIADLMGLPLSDGRDLYRLTEVIHSDPSSLPEGAAAAAVGAMFEYGQSVIKDKRAKPGDDLASQLLSAELDGRKLSDEEFLLFFMLLVDAGGDTTRNLVGTGLYELLNAPEQWAALAQNLGTMMPKARDELLRLTSPVIYMRRTLKQDFNLHDVAMNSGDKVVMYYGAANRDPRIFDRPHELDIHRDGARHLAFGGGHHVCLGQWFARLEIDAILMEVIKRLKNIKVLEAPQWLNSTFISGMTHLPVSFERR